MSEDNEHETRNKQVFVEMQSFVETHQEPFVVLDKDYCIRSVNGPFEKQYGFSRDSIRGRKCFEVTRMTNIPCHELGEACPYYQVFMHGQPSVWRHAHYSRHGQLRRVLVRGYPLIGEDGVKYAGMSYSTIAAQDLGIFLPFENMVGESPEFLEFREKLKMASLSLVPVLLTGETGAGKHCAATYIHAVSDRRDKPFVTVDCATLSETLFESELFGSEQSSLMAANNEQESLLHLARGGTLFLDEISEMPFDIQRKILSLLVTGQFRKVGGRKTLRADIRLICATSHDLSERVKYDEFRSDLYHRLAVMNINVPPLRKRPSDIPLLAEALLRRIGAHMLREFSLTKNALDYLMSYEYPGNIRELLTVLQSSASISRDGEIGLAEIGRFLPLRHPAKGTGFPSPSAVGADASTKKIVRAAEEQHIRDMLKKLADNRRSTASALGISERTLYRKMRYYGIE